MVQTLKKKRITIREHELQHLCTVRWVGGKLGVLNSSVRNQHFEAPKMFEMTPNILDNFSTNGLY